MLYKFGFENNFLGVKFITNNFMKQQFTFLNFAQVASVPFWKYCTLRLQMNVFMGSHVL